jgi:predicted alpha/beta-fold hydrolase
VAISVPFLLDHCATKLDSGFSRLYNQYLLYNLKQYIHDKRAHLQRIQQHAEADILAALGNLRGIHSFWQYDQQVISALYGFKDVHDYYQQSSSRQFLHAIRVPTLIIQAADDPFMTPAVIPDAHELSDSVTVEVSERGGHVGFVTGESPLQPRYWLDERIPAYIANALHAR